jgi:PAS domain S-box-containing protein
MGASPIETKRGGPSSRIESQYSPQRVVMLACLTGVLCYLTARLGGLLTPRPLLVSPLWLGNVLLTAMLLLVRRRTWPALLVPGLAGFVLYDLQAGEPIRSVVSFVLSNAVEVLVAAWCLSSSFNGVPRLNSVKALAKYSFYAVFLAPFLGAFLGALSSSSYYWPSWRVAFLSEAIGFLTLMPAILGWVGEIPTWSQKQGGYYAEVATLVVAWVVVGYLVFDTAEKSISPALLYSLVPLLLWSTLRFGSIGASTSMLAIAFVSIWGAVHGRGPFTGPGQLIQVLSLQLFLFFTAAPFMVLAVLVEQHKHDVHALRESEERLRVGAEISRMYAWEWDPATDSVQRTAESAHILGLAGATHQGSAKEYFTQIHPDDRTGLWGLVNSLTPGDPVYRTQYRRFHPSGDLLWLEERGCGRFDEKGKMVRLVGMTVDITDRKRAEEALASVGRRLISSQEQERHRIARELHDDIGQRLALLTGHLDQLSQGSPDVPDTVRGRLSELEKQSSEIATDVQTLSHGLHSSKLRILGVAAAIRGFCTELSEQKKVRIAFKNYDVPASLPEELSLCLFRVTQEALHNAEKHSGVRHFGVQLWGTPGEIHLTIMDTGAGFDKEVAKESLGLGLTSMQERMNLLNGMLSIETQPGRGTKVRASFPLISKRNS